MAVTTACGSNVGELFPSGSSAPDSELVAAAGAGGGAGADAGQAGGSNPDPKGGSGGAGGTGGTGSKPNPAEGATDGGSAPALASGPLAEGHDKFLGGVCCGNQAVSFTRYFNQVTPENAGKWGSVERDRDDFRWEPLDEAYALAKDNGFPFKLHVLIWGDQQPTWLRGLPATEQLEEIQEWFSALSERYGDIDFVEVVNEFENDPPDSESNGQNAGPGYIDALRSANPNTSAALQTEFELRGLAATDAAETAANYDWVVNSFELARRAFPESQLMLNEYNVLNTPARAGRMLELVELLKDRKLIDAVAVQGHAFSLRVSNKLLTSNLDTLAAAGLDLYISELDIDGPTDGVQLREYQRVFPALWEHEAIRGVTLWGYRPGHWRESSGAHLALEDGQEKPALTWLRGYLRGFAPEIVAPKAALELAEGTPAGAAVTTLSATGPNGAALEPSAELRWALLGGRGSEAFSIDAATGTVAVVAPPSPGSNVLSVQVQSTQEGQTFGSGLLELEVLVAGKVAPEVTTFDFEDSAQGFRADFGTEASAAHDAERGALVITPDPLADSQYIIGGTPLTDFSGAEIQYTVTATQPQASGNLRARGYVQTGAPSYTRIFGDSVALAVGSNTFTFRPTDDQSGNLQIVERVAIEFQGPETSGRGEEILLNQVVVTLPGR